MQIQVIAEDSISPQARTYAEYRIFAALAQVVDTDDVRSAQVVLSHASRLRGSAGIACTVTVYLRGTDALRVRAFGDHPYAAINRAVERLTAFRRGALVGVESSSLRKAQ